MAERELKDRYVEWKGKRLFFRCTDDVFPRLSQDPAFLDELWLDKAVAERQPREDRLESVFRQQDLLWQADWERKKPFRKPREIQWRGNTLRFEATDEEFEQWKNDDSFLRGMWFYEEWVAHGKTSAWSEEQSKSSRDKWSKGWLDEAADAGEPDA
ncbi:MAG: hypothetical protein K2X82_02125 [Gemmataceae bacterium]|nr:hypothetical protein [Gemmataceae bacterium]